MSSETVREDARAGLTVALLAVPQCMAYALLAEMSPVYGLYAAFVGVMVAALFASSNIVITGPTAKISLVVGSVIVAYGELPPVETVVILTLMVGLMQIGISLVGAGDLAAFVSRSVIRGFIVGGGMVIIGDQLIYLLNAVGDKSPYFVIRVYDAAEVVYERGSVPTIRVALGIGTVLFIIMLRRIHESLPAGILTIVAGGFLSAWLQFPDLGVDLVGRIPRTLPEFTPPVLSLRHVLNLFPGALALMILCSVQTVSISKSIAQKHRTDVNENQDLFGQGMANLFTGLFQGFPVAASFTRSFFNDSLGARTRMSGVFCGIFIALIILVAAPYAYYLPIPVLAGLIIVVVSDIFDWSEIRTVLTITHIDRLAFSVTCLSTLFLRLDTAIYVGVATTLLIYVKKSATLDLKEYILTDDGELKHITTPGERENEQIAIVDVNGEIYFGAAESIRRRVRNLLDESEELRIVILRLKNALSVDSGSVKVFQEIAEEMRRRDRTLILSGVTPKIQEALVHTGVAQTIGEDKILIAQTELLESTRRAIERAENHIEAVLEGSVDYADEEPDLKNTLEQLLRKADTEHGQEPIDAERKTSE